MWSAYSLKIYRFYCLLVVTSFLKIFRKSYEKFTNSIFIERFLNRFFYDFERSDQGRTILTKIIWNPCVYGHSERLRVPFTLHSPSPHPHHALIPDLA